MQLQGKEPKKETREPRDPVLLEEAGSGLLALSTEGPVFLDSV